jgi:catechol 2,3-dioxygenase-like lactoylglutathione lyase family enzyme
MTVLALDHVNLRTPYPARTIRFFREVLLMKVGGPPGMAAGEGGWVYDSNDLPVVHIGAAESPYPTDELIPFSPATGGGAVHHVALRCADYAGVKGRLRALDLEFHESAYPKLGLTQIFVAEPNGVLFELNFREGEGAPAA